MAARGGMYRTHVDHAPKFTRSKFNTSPVQERVGIQEEDSDDSFMDSPPNEAEEGGDGDGDDGDDDEGEGQGEEEGQEMERRMRRCIQQ